jgi:hypothetical protein
MKTTELQLFVLGACGSIRWEPKHLGWHVIYNPYIGKRNVSSTFKTLRKRKWIQYRWSGPVEQTFLGKMVLLDSCYEVQS